MSAAQPMEYERRLDNYVRQNEQCRGGRGDLTARQYRQLRKGDKRDLGVVVKMLKAKLAATQVEENVNV